MTPDTAAPMASPGDDTLLRRIGYGVMATVFLGFGGWAAIAPIEGAAVAPGVVTVDGARKTVQHLEGGIVRALHVTEGQWVEQGALLIELEGRQFKSELEAVRAQHATLAATQARLIAERDERATVAFPQSVTLAADDQRLLDARSGQLGLFTARRKAYQGEVSVLQQTVAQLREQVTGIRSVIASKRQLVASYQAEIGDLRELVAEGFADRQKLREYERNVAALTGEISELEASVAAAAARMGESELRMLQVRRDFQAAVATELGETQVKLADLTERLDAVSDRVTRTELRAPVSGRVMQLKAHTVGGVVAPGEPILEIVPGRDELIVDARVSPMDIDRVHAGLGATVQLSGLRHDQGSRLKGQVRTISADRIVEEHTGTAYYRAQVAIDAADRARLQGPLLQAGMPANVMINTGQRTLLAYLADPIQNAIQRSFRED